MMARLSLVAKLAISVHSYDIPLFCNELFQPQPQRGVELL